MDQLVERTHYLDCVQITMVESFGVEDRGHFYDPVGARPRPCPYGTGAHPYLTVGTETVDAVILRAPAGTVLETDERGIPVGRASVAGTEYDFREPRPIGATTLDHAFTDLDRDGDGLARVRLIDPGTETELVL